MAFVAIKGVVSELSPVNLALMRWLVAGVPFLVLLPIIGRPKVSFERKDAPRLIVVAMANVAGYHLSLNYAETTLSAGLSALLIAFGPIFIVLLSYVLLGEKLSRRIFLGLILAIAGTLVISLGSIWKGSSKRCSLPSAMPSLRFWESPSSRSTALLRLPFWLA
jgi:drug/metabolite transporter (DMT)-like permease